MQEQPIRENEGIASQPRKRPWLLYAIIALGCAGPILLFLFVIYVAQPVKVEGTAMVPTLNDGDRIFIGKRIGNLQRGDIVFFYYPQDTSKSFIKRIVGLPGEQPDINDEGQITVDGRVLDEPYLKAERNQIARVRWQRVRPDWKRVPDEGFFVMGDNRDASNDSRSWGPVPKQLIYGKVIARYYPFGEPLK